MSLTPEGIAFGYQLRIKGLVSCDVTQENSGALGGGLILDVSPRSLKGPVSQDLRCFTILKSSCGEEKALRGATGNC